MNCNTKRGPREKRHYFSWEEVPPAEEAQRTEPTGGRPNPVHRAREWQAVIEEYGESRAALARRLGVSRARVTQVLGILDLAPDALELLEQQAGPEMVPERALRNLRSLSPTDQRDGVMGLLLGHRASGPAGPRQSS